MGRYYSGDIEGKFWFAVQDSNAADRFGSIGFEPNYIEYYFTKENDLKNVQKELDIIKKTIGKKNIIKIEKFFNSNNSYNDKILEKEGILEIWNIYKSDYADLLLGQKIEKCLIKNGDCSFTAEL